MKMGWKKWLTAISVFGLVGVSTSVQAAETVILRRGSTTRTVQLEDLKTYVQTGTIPQSLQEASRLLTPEQRNQVQDALKAKYNISPVGVRRFLDTEYGDRLIFAIARTTPRTDRVGALDVKSGLVLGANNPDGLSIINFIQAYPRQTLEIDINRAFKLTDFNANFWRTQAFIAAVTPQLTPRKPNITLPFDPTQAGNAKVQILKTTVNDTQRNREIPLDIYWSSASSPDKPVIVFSHGLGSIRTDMRYLAEYLASYGYIVAALEHPGSNETHVRQALALKATLLEAEEFINRSKDISFVLDELNKLNQTGELQGKIATDKAMVIGYSLGGSTALSLAGAEFQLTQLKQRCSLNILANSLGENIQCFAKGLPEDRYQLRDPRIKAAIALSPVTSLLFGETGLSQVAIPTLILAGSADKTAPALTEQVLGFEEIPQPKYLVGIIGGTHLSVKDPSTTTDQAGQPDTIYSGGEIVGEQAIDVRNYVKAIALSMAAQLTPEAEQYAIFLTSDYAQFASTQAFPIRLVREIPPQAEVVLREFSQNR